MQTFFFRPGALLECEFDNIWLYTWNKSYSFQQTQHFGPQNWVHYITEEHCTIMEKPFPFILCNSSPNCYDSKKSPPQTQKARFISLTNKDKTPNHNSLGSSRMISSIVCGGFKHYLYALIRIYYEKNIKSMILWIASINPEQQKIVLC